MFMGLSIFIFLLNSINADCPSGSLTVQDMNLCLLPLNITATIFSNADSYCQEYGGNVVRIENIFVNSYVQSLAQQSLTTDTTFVQAWRWYNTWQYLDGKALTYSKWDIGEPNDDEFDKNCAQMNLTTGLWSTIFCASDMLQPICGIPMNYTKPIQPTIQPIPCLDCYPSSDNILFIIDPNNEYLRDDTNQTIVDLKIVLKSLMINWTHFDRIAFGSVFPGDKYNYFDTIGYGEINSYNAVEKIIDNITTWSFAHGGLNLADLFDTMNTTFPLNPTYTGRQKTVVFTISQDLLQYYPRIIPSGEAVKAMGSMIFVSLDLNFLVSYGMVASPDSAFLWNTTADHQQLIDFLDFHLAQ